MAAAAVLCSPLLQSLCNIGNSDRYVQSPRALYPSTIQWFLSLGLAGRRGIVVIFAMKAGERQFSGDRKKTPCYGVSSWWTGS